MKHMKSLGVHVLIHVVKLRVLRIHRVGGAVKGLPVQISLDFMWSRAKWICCYWHVDLHMAVIIWVVPKQPRMR